MMSGQPRTFQSLSSAAGLPVDSTNGAAECVISDVTDDSRRVAPGSVFVAVPGVAADGHRFATAASEAGATIVVAEREVEVASGTVVVRTSDARSALARLASAWYGLRGRGAAGCPLVGVTGTNGKTTVAWMVRSILRCAGAKPAMLGTVEYDLVGERRVASLTTPGSIELCRALAAAKGHGATHAVMEVSSHALDQRRCDGLEFSVAAFTNLTGDHLDYHRTMESYLVAKRRLFELLPTEGAAVVNTDDSWSKRIVEGCRAAVYGYSACEPDAAIRAVVDVSDRSGQRFRLYLPDGEEVIVPLPLVGGHNVQNALAAAGAAHALGVEGRYISEGLSRVGVVPGRLQRVEANDTPFSVLVDYAHTDDALRNVLEAVRGFTPGRVICVFGAGGDRDRTKRPRMAATVARLSDVAVVTTDNPRTESPSAIIDEIMTGFPAGGACQVMREVDRRAAITLALAEARRGDCVLIAGKGHENYQEVHGVRHHFDDAETAREVLTGAATGGRGV